MHRFPETSGGSEGGPSAIRLAVDRAARQCSGDDVAGLNEAASQGKDRDPCRPRCRIKSQARSCIRTVSTDNTRRYWTEFESRISRWARWGLLPAKVAGRPQPRLLPSSFLPCFPQPYARAATVLAEEVDPSSFQGGSKLFSGFRTPSQFSFGGFQTFHRWEGDARFRRKFLLGPTQQGPGCLQLRD